MDKTFKSLLSAIIQRPQVTIFAFLWSSVSVFFFFLGIYGIYRLGWLLSVIVILAVLYLLQFSVSYFWPSKKLNDPSIRIKVPQNEYWTQKDYEAVREAEAYRATLADVDWKTLTTVDRYYTDARNLAERIARHYRGTQSTPLSITPVELLAAIHLITEELEVWVSQNVPLSHDVTVQFVLPSNNSLQTKSLNLVGKFIEHLPKLQRLYFLVTSAAHPVKLAAYPLWEFSTRLGDSLQKQLAREFYLYYLRQVSYYLIELYSGRLKAGSEAYREHFHQTSMALHYADLAQGTLESAKSTNIAIALMGQVKAGKSSLINALTRSSNAKVHHLPQTREIDEFELPVTGSANSVYLLDTPGYAESGADKSQLNAIENASERADLLFIVMAANTSARDADLQMIEAIESHYVEHPELKKPITIGVLTHIDELGSPKDQTVNYNWRTPTTRYDKLVASAVDYCREVFGSSINNYACISLRPNESADSTLMEEAIARELLPLIQTYLGESKTVAIVKAFYGKFNQERINRITSQTLSAAKWIVSKALS